MPTDAELETSLRDAVRALYDDPDASVRRIRAQAEEDLGVEEGFFKNEDWKERSKEIIQDQFDRKEEEQRASKTKKRPSPSTEGSRPRKKSRVENVREEEEESSTALSEPPESDEENEEEAPRRKTKAQQQKTGKKAGKPAKSVKKPALKKEKLEPKAKKPASSESELSDAPSEPADDKEEEAEAKPASKAQGDNDDTSSELSSVIDDPEPVKKKSKAKNGDTKSSTKQRRSSASTKSKPASEADRNAEEIKRLQGWLVKCGIRKVWGKELKPFDTPRAKIAHLKKMLSDVGMTGRYSNEKAAQIKEARELAADIEAVREGNERWGKDEDGSADEEDGSGKDGARPKRRLVRGAANYDFLSSDGEETD